MDPTLQFYSNFITDHNLLAQGHTLIRNFLLQSKANRSSTLQNLIVANPPILTLVGNVYPCDVFSCLEEQEKIQTRLYLMDLLFKVIGSQGVGSKMSANLISFISRTHSQEGYDKWLSLYADFIKNIEPKHFAAFIIAILQNADNRISTLAINIFSYIVNNIQANNSQFFSFVTKEELFKILYLAIKSFSYLNGTDDQTLQAHFNPYEKWLVGFIWGNLNNNPTCLKYALKMLTILYGDMERFDNNEENIIFLIKVGIQLTQQYLKYICNPNFKGELQDELEQTQQDHPTNTAINLERDISTILSQYLELFSIIIPSLEQLDEESGKKGVIILKCSFLLTLPSKSQIQYWSQNSDQYLISIDDQFDKNLRNRANDMIVRLVQDSENKALYRKIIREYLTVVVQGIHQSNRILLLQQYINADNVFGLLLSLQNLPYQSLQQSAYFILASVVQQLFPSDQLPQLLSHLCNRSRQTSNCLIKIVTIYIVVMQSNPNSHLTKEFSQFILDQINRFEIEKLSLENMGVLLALGRGLGKLGDKNKLQIGVSISFGFIQGLAHYIGRQTHTKPDEDCTHIVLQILLKLSESHPNNRKYLEQLINPALQLHMIKNYMHDGLLSCIVFKILQEYPHQQIVNILGNSLMTGTITQEKYCELLAKYIKKSLLAFSTDHISSLLKTYKKNYSIISPIILLYLKSLKETKSEAPASLINELNFSHDQTWLVPMLQCGILQNVELSICSCIKKIVQEITSQYEIQRKMILPFYLGIYQSAHFLAILQQTTVYQAFIQKIYRYAKLFQGKNLKMISSLWFLNLSDHDSQLSTKSIELIQGYGKLEASQWQDEEGGDQEEQENLIEKLMNCSLENEYVEKQLEQSFSDIINQETGKYIEQKVKKLKSQI